MLYNAGIPKEVNNAYENNAGLNINRDIDRLKEFAKAMGHNILAEQTSELNASLHTLRSAFMEAIGDYELEIKEPHFCVLFTSFAIIYLRTDKGYVSTTINKVNYSVDMKHFYFEGNSVFRIYTRLRALEFSEVCINKSYMWQLELPYLFLFVNAFAAHYADILGTGNGIIIKYKNGITLPLRFNYKHKVFKGKEGERSISFKNAMKRSKKVANWLIANSQAS